MKTFLAIILMAAAIVAMPANAGVISFAPCVTIPTGSYPEVVAIGDVNNDGRNDVVLGTSYGADSLHDYKILVFTQTDGGALNPPQVYDAGFVTSIDIADLNNDGRDDVVIGFDDSIAIFMQDTISHLLQPKVCYYSGTDVDGLKTGDFNNDGLRDIAVCHWNSNFIRIFRQQPNGNFDLSQTYPINAGGSDEMDAGDVNGDGLVDVVFMRGQTFGTQNIAVFKQDTTGQLMDPVCYDLGDTSTSGVAVGDVNTDGRNDIVASYGGNSPSAGIALWIQDSIGGLIDSPQTLPCYDIPKPVEIADFDCDGRNDIVVGNGGWFAVSIYRQKNDGTMEPFDTTYIPSDNPLRAQGLAVGDINSDGKPDIAIADINHGLLILYNTSNTGVSDKPIAAAPTATRLAVRAFPNPSFGPVTISYELSQQKHAAIAMYNVAGQKVRTIFQGNALAGQHNAQWDGRDDQGNKVSTGTYLCRLSTAAGSALSRLVVLR